jgi:hypothetical protein
MLIEAALYSLLANSSGVTDIVGTRIYPVQMPQLERGTAVYPALTYALDARARRQTHNGPTPLVESRYTIMSYAKEYFDAISLAEQVRLALNGKSADLAAIYENDVGGIFLEDEIHEYGIDEVEELALYRSQMEFVIQHNEEV